MLRPTPLLIATLAFAILTLACGASRNMIPTDAIVPPGDEVDIRAGASVHFIAFDDIPVDATHLIASPGNHEIEFEVRRNL